MSKNSRNRGGMALMFLCHGGRGEARARSPMVFGIIRCPTRLGWICAWVGRVGRGSIVLLGVACFLCSALCTVCSGPDVLAFGSWVPFFFIPNVLALGSKKICCLRVIDVVRVWLSCTWAGLFHTCHGFGLCVGAVSLRGLCSRDIGDIW